MIVVYSSTKYTLPNPDFDGYKIIDLRPKVRFEAEKGYFHQREQYSVVRARVECTWRIITQTEYNTLTGMITTIGSNSCYLVPLDKAQSGSSYAWLCKIITGEIPRTLEAPDRSASGYAYGVSLQFESIAGLAVYSIPA